MSSATLKLTREDEPCEPLPFERRAAKRHIVGGNVTAIRTDFAHQAHQHRITALQMINMSDTGIGALCQEQIDLNTPIVVFFPPHGAEGGFDAYGHVVRCESRDHGHELGIQFDVRPAA